MTRLLSTHFNLIPSSSSSSTEEKEVTKVDALILNLEELHSILIKFWIKLWNQSPFGYTTNEQQEGDGDEFDKISGMVRSQVKDTLSVKGRGLEEIKK